MGMPKKGTHVVTYLNNQQFRYGVKLVNIPGHKDQKELLLTVQENKPKPGNVMQARYGYWSKIEPAFVMREIFRALKLGWNPSARGRAFVLPKETS